jgi:hypothetical protein
MVKRMSRALGGLWRTDKPLTAVGLLMLGELAAALVLMLTDPRVVAGAPAWLKPAKFGASTAIYCLTLAWMFRYLPDWPRMRRIVSLTTSIVFLLEIPIVVVQAWRGTTSHFNVSTPFDGTLYALMGVGILIQTLASVIAAVSLWRQRFADETIGWACRAGLTITVIGALTGGLMTRPTAAQLAEARTTHRMPAAGAHTVGAPDGGRGLPGTGWSREHGDLRVPHFVGLHAIQVLAVLAVLIRRRHASASAIRVVQLASLSYVLLFALLLWQALRGESLIAPGPTTLVAIGGWATFTVTGLWAARVLKGTPSGRRQGSAILTS